MESKISSAVPEARLHFIDYWRVVKSRWIFVLIVWLVAVLAVAAITWTQTPVYSASAKMKVEQDRPSVDVFIPRAYQSYDPFFLQTQYEMLQSKRILYPVIEKCDLTKIWGSGGSPLPANYTFDKLKSALSVRRYRDTSFIEVTITDRDPKLAADIANAIVDVFERDRLDQKRDETLRGISKLRDELKDQLKRLQEAQTKVEKLRKELQVPVFGGIKLSDLTLQRLETDLAQARVEAVARDVRQLELSKLTSAQLRNTIPIFSNDPNVRNLIQSLASAELELEKLKQDLGPEHPSVRTAQTSIEKLNDQINAQLSGILDSFKLEYKEAQARVDTLQKQLDEAKSKSVELESEKYLPFRNAQAEEDHERRIYEQLKERINKEMIEMQVPRNPVEKTDPAEPGLFPVRPRKTLNMLLGVAAGLVLGVTLAFFIEFLDTSVKRIEDVEQYLELPVVGVIPQGAASIVDGAITPRDLEAYRMLRANLEFSRNQKGAHACCVLSAAPGEGKSFTVINLAGVYAQHGARVLVVDCDLRRPNVHNLLRVTGEKGLADFLTGRAEADAVIHPTAVPGVSAIPAGTAGQFREALPRLGSERMAALIAELAKHFDLVLYDTPPLLAVSEAASLAREVGNSILVVQHRRYPRQMTRRARQLVEQAGGRLLGAVVNNVALAQADAYFYYQHQYDEYVRGPVTPPANRKDGPATGRARSDEIKLPEKY